MCSSDLSIRSQWDVLVAYLKHEKDIEASTSQPARKLVLLTSLKPFVKIIDASQGCWRSNVAPRHVASMMKFYETWKTITNQKQVEEVDLELSFCHFGTFSISTREQKQMGRTYIKCAGHALLEYEKVPEDTTELV